jgi:2,4-dienoyl-CoA reductase-like NADH-dependent reductase (Old Yellow Enzyme family)
MIRNELTKPFILKSLSLPGRVVMAPMTRSRSPHNIPGPDQS